MTRATFSQEAQELSAGIFGSAHGDQGCSPMEWRNKTGKVWWHGSAVCLAQERRGLGSEDGDAWRRVVGAVSMIWRINAFPFVVNLNLGYNWILKQDCDPRPTSGFTRAWLRNWSWNLPERPSHVSRFKFHRKWLVGFTDNYSQYGSNRISLSLEVFAGEEWAKIPQGWGVCSLSVACL